MNFGRAFHSRCCRAAIDLHFRLYFTCSLQAKSHNAHVFFPFWFLYPSRMMENVW
jgi:hypothetical protein